MSPSLIASCTSSCVKYTLSITIQGNYNIKLMKLYYSPTSYTKVYYHIKYSLGTPYIQYRFTKDYVFDTFEEADAVGNKLSKDLIDSRIKQYEKNIHYLSQRLLKLKSKVPKRSFKDLLE